MMPSCNTTMSIMSPIATMEPMSPMTGVSGPLPVTARVSFLCVSISLGKLFLMNLNSKSISWNLFHYRTIQRFDNSVAVKALENIVGTGLTLFHIIPTFDDPVKEAF